MEFLTKEQAAERLGVHARKIDRFRVNGIQTKDGNQIFLQSLSTGDRGGGPVRIPLATMAFPEDSTSSRAEGQTYLGLDSFIVELVRRNEHREWQRKVHEVDGPDPRLVQDEELDQYLAEQGN
jgi:hypothetical protein